MSAPLIVDRHAGGVTLTLDRPAKRNALSGELVEALIEAVDTAHAEGVEVIVLRGTGKSFSAGFDFSGWQDASEGDLVLRFLRIEMLLDRIARSPAVTIACAQGRNFGAGVDLFGACKRRIAEADATFRMPGLNFGLVLGTRRFAACVGRDAAREIQASTRTFDADAERGAERLAGAHRSRIRAHAGCDPGAAAHRPRRRSLGSRPRPARPLRGRARAQETDRGVSRAP